MALKQNNLVEATTEQGFPTETSIPLQREVELEDGTIVTVEGVTPEKLATELGITYKTPGEPYVTSDGTTLEGVCQTYNEGHSNPKFDTITSGNSYKLKPKQKLDTIDAMNTEEVTEFFNDINNKISIGDVSCEYPGNRGNTISAAYIENIGTAIELTFIKDSKYHKINYFPQCMVDLESFPVNEPGWYTLNPVSGKYEFTSVNEVIIENIVSIQNNVSYDMKTLTFSGNDISSYDSSNLDWLFDSVENVKVEASKLTFIEINTPPTKTEYSVGELFDPSGMFVTAFYDNNKVRAITDYTYSPSGELTETDTEITISYTENKITKTAEQSIIISEEPKTINFVKGHTYVYDYPKLSAYITQQLISSGKMDTVNTLHILNFGCGNNPPTIELGTLEASGHGEHPGGIVQGETNDIGFGTDYISFGGNISEAWDPGDAFDSFLEFLTNAGIIEEEYDFTNSTFVPNENITLNLDACGETYTTSVGANINWITEKN